MFYFSLPPHPPHPPYQPEVLLLTVVIVVCYIKYQKLNIAKYVWLNIRLLWLEKLKAWGL